MEYILSPKQMQDMDKRTIHEFGIASRILMETAGAKCADAIIKAYPEETDASIVVLCGSGNNGGDGYVIARHLYDETQSMLIISLGKNPASEESRINRELCEKLGISILDIPDADAWDQVREHLVGDCGILIDAIFGIGFKGEMPKYIEEVLVDLSVSAKATVAIDIPSGANANNGLGFVYMADMTLAIEEYKRGHFLGSGPVSCGVLCRIPIGIPADYKTDVDTLLYRFPALPTRYVNAHKGDYGRVYIIGGSEGYVGSVRLSAKAALRSGAGLVHICSRKEILGHYAGFADEVMNFAIPEGVDGLPSAEHLAALISKADSISIGSGMGLDDYALQLLKIVLKQATCPLVIDADAITLLSQNPDLLPLLKNVRCVLTPHPGEFCRLAGISIETLRQAPVGELKKLREALACDILLKGHTSLFAGCEVIFFIRAGNDALATGGSGDLLAGIIASFLAQKLHPDFAAPSAALLLGKTAELLSSKKHSFSILPSDIIDHLGDYHD